MLVLGLSGATCSGKTSTCNILQRIFVNSRLFKQDDYYWHEDSKNHVRDENSVVNWELQSAFDMNSLYKDVHSEVQSSSSNEKRLNTSPEDWTVDKLFSNEKSCELSIDPERFKHIRLIMVEGITVLNDMRISDLCDYRFFIELDHTTCWNRRQQRTCDPEDQEGYFERYAWPYYHSNLEHLKSTGRALKYLNGRESIQEHVCQILRNISIDQHS